MHKELQLIKKIEKARMPAFRVTSIIDRDTFEVSPK
jgi:hypothetical protein